MSSHAGEDQTKTCHRRYLKNYLIDKQFQIGWVTRVAVVTFLIVFTLGFFLYRTLNESIEMVNIQALSKMQLTSDAQAAIISAGARDKLVTGMVLGGSLMGLVLILSLLTIVVTHRTAGPMYKMKRLLGDVSGSHLQLFEQLRKGDNFADVFDAFGLMLQRLRESRHMDIERIEGVLRRLEKQGVPPEDYAELQMIVDRYKQSIRMEDAKAQER